MIAARWTPGSRRAWVTGDEVYGADPGCAPSWRPAASATCWRSPATTRARRRRHPACRRPAPAAPRAGLAARLGRQGRQGPPLLRLGVPPPGRRDANTGRRASTGCWSAATSGPASWPSTAATRPDPVPLAILVRVAGRRWTIEERFQAGKGLVGLDQHQVRRWRSWYRWTTLAMLAHAFLVVGRDRTRPPPTTVRADRVDLQRDPAPVRAAPWRTRCPSPPRTWMPPSPPR